MKDRKAIYPFGNRAEEAPCWCEEENEAPTGEEVEVQAGRPLRHTLEFTLRIRVDGEAVSLLYRLSQERGETFVKGLLRSIRAEARQEFQRLLHQRLSQAL